MAATHPDTRAVPERLRRLAVAALLAAAPSLLAAQAAQPAQTAKPAQGRNAEIVLDAASSDVDYRSNTLLFRDVVITQGPLRVQAERARHRSRLQGRDLDLQRQGAHRCRGRHAALG
jgi:lipopolysaccharide export system protein LptA